MQLQVPRGLGCAILPGGARAGAAAVTWGTPRVGRFLYCFNCCGILSSIRLLKSSGLEYLYLSVYNWQLEALFLARWTYLLHCEGPASSLGSIVLRVNLQEERVDEAQWVLNGWLLSHTLRSLTSVRVFSCDSGFRFNFLTVPYGTFGRYCPV